MTYYWLDVVSSAGRFFFKGAAPPPSRKFCEMGGFVTRLNSVPLLVEMSQPLKYGSKLTAVSLYSPFGFRIPGTKTPLLGYSSVRIACQNMMLLRIRTSV